MPDISKWVGNKTVVRSWLDPVDYEGRAYHYAQHTILDDPTEIVIERADGTDLSAQTVRIEMTRIEPDKTNQQVARMSRYNAVVTGFRDHDTYPDFDVRQGDKFHHEGFNFEVTVVYKDLHGIIQAWCEAQQ